MWVETNSGSFETEEEELLLDALEKNGYAPEYQCRAGYCGTCRLKILRGRVKYVRFPLAYLLPDEILPCSCVAAENLYLNINLPEREATEDFFTEPE
ncbi:MAG: [Fe-S]-binding protein [Haemophilus parainfluenzae]|jgi:2Fe-2S iron-sulfur cluster binding protein|nr:MAG: [Fe-S]-binding protein [Haemophilus parainfluenzae]